MKIIGQQKFFSYNKRNKYINETSLTINGKYHYSKNWLFLSKQAKIFSLIIIGLLLIFSPTLSFNTFYIYIYLF